MRICCGRSTSLWLKWSVKIHCVVTVLLAIWEIFLYESNRNYNSYRLSCKFPFILFLSFLTNQKQETCFQQVGSMVTRNIFVFFVYSKSHVGIFWYVIPVRISSMFHGNTLISPSHTWLIILIWFITLKINWMNPCMKTKRKETNQ